MCATATRIAMSTSSTAKEISCCNSGSAASRTGGVGPGIFDNTGRVATDASGNVWVTSPDFSTMQEFDSSGKFVTMVCMADVGVANCPVTTPFSVQPQGIGI